MVLMSRNEEILIGDKLKLLGDEGRCVCVILVSRKSW